MKKIESEADLFKHFKDIGISKLMSTIVIPEVGEFKIFPQEEEDLQPEKGLQEGDLVVNKEELFKQWDKVLMKIKPKVGRPSFETWFKRTLAMKLDDQHMCIICANSFGLDWLKSHYEDTIISAFKEVTGDHFELEFCVGKLL